MQHVYQTAEFYRQPPGISESGEKEEKIKQADMCWMYVWNWHLAQRKYIKMRNHITVRGSGGRRVRRHTDIDGNYQLFRGGISGSRNR